MSEVYYLLAAISYGIFLVQFILSWFGGDTDLDVDLDGELDMNVSDIVSFKGLIHFIMGASGWLCVKQSVSHSVEEMEKLMLEFAKFNIKPSDVLGKTVIFECKSISAYE